MSTEPVVCEVGDRRELSSPLDDFEGFRTVELLERRFVAFEDLGVVSADDEQAGRVESVRRLPREVDPPPTRDDGPNVGVGAPGRAECCRRASARAEISDREVTNVRTSVDHAVATTQVVGAYSPEG